MADTARIERAEHISLYILIAGTGLGVVLRFFALGAHSFWVDELLTIKNAHIGEPGIFSYIAHNLQGPAVSLLVHYWGAVGKSEVVLRLPFAAVGALTVPAIYALAREVSDKWTSLHTAVLLALSPLHIWYSQEVRGYAFVVLFSVLANYFFIKWVKERRPKSIALYAVCVFAGLVSNLSMVFIATAHFLYLLLRRWEGRTVLWWAVAICLVLAAFSPWLNEIMVRVQPQRVVAGEIGEPLIAGSGFSAMGVPYSIFAFGAGYTLGPSPRDLQLDRRGSIMSNIHYIVLAAVALGIPLFAGLVQASKTDRDLTTLLILIMLVPAFAVIALSARNIKPFNPRYLLVALPAFVMLLAIGTAKLTRSRYGLLVLPLLVLLALSIGNYFGNPHYAKDDLRAAARAIERDYRTGDVVVAVFTAEPLEFYLDGVAEVKVFGRNDISSPESMTDRCKGLAEGADRVWLSLCREWQVDPDGHIHRWFDGNLNELDRLSFPGVRLFLYDKRGT